MSFFYAFVWRCSQFAFGADGGSFVESAEMKENAVLALSSYACLCTIRSLQCARGVARAVLGLWRMVKKKGEHMKTSMKKRGETWEVAA